MRKWTRRAISGVVIGMLAFSIAMPIFALEEDLTDDEIMVETTIVSLSDELESSGVTVEVGMQTKLERLEQDKQAATTEQEAMQIQELIDTAKFLLASYMDYTNPSPTRTVQTYGIYDPVIAVVSTYFEVNKYYLADELLVHAASNTRLDSQYIPINIDRITSSRVWQEIRKDKGRSGIGEFANTGTTVQKDLYYAIHLFEWSREKKGSPAASFLC